MKPGVEFLTSAKRDSLARLSKSNEKSNGLVSGSLSSWVVILLQKKSSNIQQMNRSSMEPGSQYKLKLSDGWGFCNSDVKRESPGSTLVLQMTSSELSPGCAWLL
jgi:hypothetical protein